MVDIVTLLPPAERQTAHKTRDEDIEDTVHVKAVRNADVAGVVGSERHLMPEGPHAHCAGHESAPMQEKQHGGEEHSVSGDFNGIRPEAAVIQALSSQAVIEAAVGGDDGVRGSVIQGRVGLEVEGDLLLSDEIEVCHGIVARAGRRNRR